MSAAAATAAATVATPSTSFHDGTISGRKLTLMGGAAFRSFRCLWMLEELAGILPYEHVVASPQSEKIKAHHPLGKIPVLLEERILVPAAGAGAAGGELQQKNKSDENNVATTTTTPAAAAAATFVMYESAAINTYLGDLARSLAGSDDDDDDDDTRRFLVPRSGTQLRGLYDQTVSCISMELDAQGLWIHRKHDAMGHHFGSIPQAVTHAKDYFEMVNQVLAQQIHDNNNNNKNNNHYCYLVGPHFTAADILYVHCLEWSRSIGWDDKWKQDPKLCGYFRICTERPAYRKVDAMRKKETAETMKRRAKL